MSSHVKKFNSLLEQVATDYPAITFISGESFCWSLQKQQITYNLDEEQPIWSLLHELGHMRAMHGSYASDTQLVQMEVEAWDNALSVAQNYGFTIDQDYIQDCLDSYRAWRHARSTCPECSQTGLEVDGTYRCINCRHIWRVSSSRFCRPYRMNIKK